MTSYIIITHDINQTEYKKFLADLDCEISTDYSAIPTMYKVEAGYKAVDVIRKDIRTLSVHDADSKVSQHQLKDEVGIPIKTGKVAGSFKRSETQIQILNINAQQDNWGLGRIDQRDAIVPEDKTKVALSKYSDRSNAFQKLFFDPAISPSDGTLVYEYSKTGIGVDVYIIDSGIRRDHIDFSGRVNELWSAFNYFDDDGGHGTHVASTVGGEQFGVAKDVTLHNVKVFGPDDVVTTLSMIIDGMNAVLTHHNNKLQSGVNRGSVANMSLTGGSSALNIVVSELKKKGIIVCAAAGNESSNLDSTFNAYPAESPDVITVTSSNNIDRPSFFNNYGDAVDVFAPGSGIIAAGYHEVDGLTSMSGTSMATPHVAGVFALALEGENILSTAAEAQQVMDFVINSSSKDKIIFDRDFTNVSHLFKNKLIYTKLTDVVIDEPVVAPPEEKKDSKKMLYIIGGAVLVIGILALIIL